jgi:predicted DNA-binding transcriptional regulator YafY
MTKDEALRLALEALEMSDICADDCKCTRKRAINGIKAALEAKDEPWEKFCDSNCVWTDHHPDCKLAQRTWQGLTEDEIVLIVAECAASHQNTDIHFARAIEAKLRSKNHDS